jgi:hypothetical protein
MGSGDGTVTTDPTAIAPNTIELAVCTIRSGTSRAAADTAVAQTPPTLMPSSRRASSITPKVGATAASTQDTAISAVRTWTATRRSSRRMSIVATGAATAPTTAGRVTSRPAAPSVTRSPSAMAGSAPTGTNSATTTENEPRAMANTAARGWRIRRARGVWDMGFLTRLIGAE